MTDEKYLRVSKVAAALLTGLGAVVLAGWTLDIRALKSVLPDAATMKANTALCFMLFGVSLWLQGRIEGERRSMTARLSALVVGAVALLTLTEVALGVDLKIDELLFKDPVGHLAPGRMSAFAATGFLLGSMALVALGAKRPWLQRASEAFALCVLLVGWIALIGYLYSVDVLVGVPGYTSMAVHTAVGFVVLAVGFFAARPHRGLLALLTQQNLAGAAARRLLPAIVIISGGVGWLRLRGQRAGLYGTEFGVALVITSSVILLAGIVLWNAHVQGLAERAQSLARGDEHLMNELGEDLRESADAAEASRRALRLLGAHLGASGCLFIEVDAARDRLVLLARYDSGSATPPLPGKLSPFSPETVAEMKAGRSVINQDAKTDPRTAAQFNETYGPMGARAYITASQIRNGQWISLTALLSGEPRVWQPREVALVQSVAKRLWLSIDRLRALESLKASEARMAAILRSALDGIISMDHHGDVVEFNPAAEDLFGHTRSKILGKPFVDLLIATSHRASLRRDLDRYFETGEGNGFGKLLQMPALRADGAEFPIEIAVVRVEGHTPPLFTAFIRDVSARAALEAKRENLVAELKALTTSLETRVEARTSELMAANEGLTKALREKEVMLKEIHHRVKNNLQVVSSLLNLQSHHILDPVAREMFDATRARVRSIALVHERLYQSKDLAQIDFGTYVRSLVDDLAHAQNTEDRGVSMTVEVMAARLSVDVAIPCGLIINELVTNCLKYAFPDRKGVIKIGLQQSGVGRMELSVEDDGVGLPQGLDPRKTDSLGLDLVFTLAEQIDAEVEVRRDSGTAFFIRFQST